MQIQQHSKRSLIQRDVTVQIQRHSQRLSIQRQGQRNFPWRFRCGFFAECQALDKRILNVPSGRMLHVPVIQSDPQFPGAFHLN